MKTVQDEKAFQEETLQTKGVGFDILSLDFTMLKLKIQDKEEGHSWSREICEETEKEYKRFLALKKAYPLIDIVPNRLVDVFWHYHILDTAAYAKDCETVFGYFLHHYPYFGMNGKDDYNNLCIAFEETKDLYLKHFGEPYADSNSMSKAGKCRTKCKPVKCK